MGRCGGAGEEFLRPSFDSGDACAQTAPRYPNLIDPEIIPDSYAYLRLANGNGHRAGEKTGSDPRPTIHQHEWLPAGTAFPPWGAVGMPDDRQSKVTALLLISICPVSRITEERLGRRIGTHLGPGGREHIEKPFCGIVLGVYESEHSRHLDPRAPAF